MATREILEEPRVGRDKSFCEIRGKYKEARGLCLPILVCL